LIPITPKKKSWTAPLSEARDEQNHVRQVSKINTHERPDMGVKWIPIKLAKLGKRLFVSRCVALRGKQQQHYALYALSFFGFIFERKSNEPKRPSAISPVELTRQKGQRPRRTAN
jgi:hypothetical protein